jgi:hypothetical protein
LRGGEEYPPVLRCVKLLLLQRRDASLVVEAEVLNAPENIHIIAAGNGAVIRGAEQFVVRAHPEEHVRLQVALRALRQELLVTVVHLERCARLRQLVNLEEQLAVAVFREHDRRHSLVLDKLVAVRVKLRRLDACKHAAVDREQQARVLAEGGLRPRRESSAVCRLPEAVPLPALGGLRGGIDIFGEPQPGTC